MIKCPNPTGIWDSPPIIHWTYPMSNEHYEAFLLERKKRRDGVIQVKSNRRFDFEVEIQEARKLINVTKVQWSHWCPHSIYSNANYWGIL